MAKPRRPKRAHPYLWSTIAALLAVGCVESYWACAYVVRDAPGKSEGTLFLADGAVIYRIDCNQAFPNAPVKWLANVEWTPKADRSLIWRPHWSGGSDPRGWAYVVWLPLWPFVAAAAAFAAIHWRRALRRPPNACPNCAYPRAGLSTNTPCPECGHAPPPSNTTA